MSYHPRGIEQRMGFAVVREPVLEVDEKAGITISLTTDDKF